MIAIFPFSFSACSKQNNKTNTKVFVGIAIYQKVENNLNWSKFTAKPSAINNLISTENNKIKVDENPALLFYIYSQNKITTATTDDTFISNTTKDKVSIKDNTISFRFERIIENTEILIYYIYKLEDNSYYLEFQDTKTNISNSTEMFEIEIKHNLFSKIKLTLETNLTIKDEY